MMKDLNNDFWDYDCKAESAEGKNSRYPCLCIIRKNKIFIC